MLRRLGNVLMPVVLGALLAWPSQAANGPRDQLKVTVDTVIATLRDESIPIEVRREQLATLVQARFDLEAISRWVLGPYWRTAGEQERKKFIELFPELIKATYLGRIEGYNDEQVVFVNEVVDGRRAEVETRILTASAEIPVNYKLVIRGDQWLVYDVIVENISLVRNFRSSYGEIVRKDGLDGLLRQMEEKIAELRKNENSPASSGP